MKALKLFMVVIGCTPRGRNTEQHDVFFGISNSLKSLIPDMYEFWPEAEKQIHIDSWREVRVVDGFQISVVPRGTVRKTDSKRLFFINLGGYKPNDMEEYHYKVLTVADSKGIAIRQSKEVTFFKHLEASHIDDKFGIDVDDIYDIEEVLSAQDKSTYDIIISPNDHLEEDELHVGYLKISKLENMKNL